MVGEVEAALDAGAIGLSTGLIYAPGMHAEPAEVEALVDGDGTARRACTRRTCATRATGCSPSLDEVDRGGPGGGLGGRGSRSRTSSAARAAVWGQAGEAIARLEAARAEGLDVAADQYPYTAAATTLATILPPALQGLGVDACVAALADPHVRDLVRAEIERGISGWENVAADPGWAGLRISYAASHPDWAGRSLAELGDELHADPSDLAFDALVADRLDVSIVIECMSEPDVETIMAVPWIAVCTDAEGRRPGHPILDAGRPHPRTYGSTARVLGRYVARPRHPVPRDGDREADLRPGRAARSPRSGRRARGGRGRSRRVRSRDRRGRGDVHRTRALPDRHRPRVRQRPAGDRRRRRDRRARRPDGRAARRGGTAFGQAQAHPHRPRHRPTCTCKYKLRMDAGRGAATATSTASRWRASTPTTSNGRPRTARAPTPTSSAAVVEAAISAGATTINLPDTVGYALPEDMAAHLRHVRNRVPGTEKVVLSTHNHNDLGLAVANTMAAIQAGVRQVECTINGIGERAGNASLEEIVMALRTRHDALPVTNSDRHAAAPADFASCCPPSPASTCSRTRRSSDATPSRTKPASTRTAC